MSKLKKPTIALFACALLALATASQAKPEYSRKEKKACGYCHTNPNGGGDRNPRGKYYAMHNHTFEGYDEEKVMGAGGEVKKKTGDPAFKSAWKVEVTATAKRLSVADVAGDKSPRLLVLDDHNKLTIVNASTPTAKDEASIELGDGGPKFVAGGFAKGKPSVIVVPGAVYYKDGDTYKKKALADLSDITGTVKFVDGNDNFFFFGGGGQPDVYAIDLTGDKTLIAGKEMVSPDSGAGVYASLIAHLPAEILEALQVPEEGRKAGIIGLFDPRSEGKLYAWIPWFDKDENTLKVTGMGLGGGDFKPIWSSPKLAGKVLDVTFGTDPRNAKQTGIFILMATGEGGKGRTVEFFSLD